MAAMAAPTDILDRYTKVVAAADLPGVPAGTPGKVILANGITWKRYRVLFENGRDLGSLDRSVLARRSEWQEPAPA